MVEGAGRVTSASVASYYPEFGEKIAAEVSNNWTRITLVVSAVAVTILCIGAIGSACSLGLAGVSFGAALSVSVVVVTYVFDQVFKNRLLCQLPQDGQHAVYQENRAKVGRYYQTDLRLAKNSEEAFQWKKHLIVSAERSIELSPNFAGGPYFRAILALIDARMEGKHELKTHIILSNDLFEPGDLEDLERLKSKFPGRFEFLVAGRHYSLGFDLHSEENHVKMLVVDGKYFVGGGTGIHHNLSTEKRENSIDIGLDSGQLAAAGMRDTDIVGQSSNLAQAMRKQFFNLYRIHEIRVKNEMVSNRYFSLSGSPGHCKKFSKRKGLVTKVRVKLIVGGPEHTGNNPIERMYAKRCEKAKNEIRIANPIFVPQESLKAALQKAKNIGTTILGYFNSNHDAPLSMHSLYAFPSRGHYHFMNTVHEYRVADQLYHKKMATFDKTHAIVGSYNIDRKSNLDNECAFLIKDERIVKQLRNLLDEDATFSEEISQEEITKNHFWNSLVTQIFEPLTQNFF